MSLPLSYNIYDNSIEEPPHKPSVEYPKAARELKRPSKCGKVRGRWTEEEHTKFL